MKRTLVVVLVASLLGGCATISTSPPIARGTLGASVLLGRLEFDGNRDFLPRPLWALPVDEPSARTVFRYRYAVTYDDAAVPFLLAAFNVLNFLGCPTGWVSVTADGVLEVLQGNDAVRRYGARSVVFRFRTMYTFGEPLSQFRRDALNAVARSIEGQLTADATALAAITGSQADRAAPDRRGDQP